MNRRQKDIRDRVCKRQSNRGNRRRNDIRDRSQNDRQNDAEAIMT